MMGGAAREDAILDLQSVQTVTTAGTFIEELPFSTRHQAPGWRVNMRCRGGVDQNGVGMHSKGITPIAVCAVSAVFAVAAASGWAKTVWLCRPGQRPDPCTHGLSTTVYTPALKQVRVDHPGRVRNPPIDCFCVYPTVSGQKPGNANLQVDPEELNRAAADRTLLPVLQGLHADVSADHNRRRRGRNADDEA